MDDDTMQKAIEEAKAKVEAGKRAAEFLAKAERLQREDRVSDLAAFKAMPPAARTQLFRDNPDRYRQLAAEWRDEAERKLVGDR